MDVQAYLERIGFEGEPKPDYQTLKRLQNCHQLTVPFENLDVILGKTPRLELEPLYQKIVVRRRGGWCHELNGLFHWLLTEVGFEADILSCHVRGEQDGTWDRAFSHMGLAIHLEGVPHFADVGWGQCQEHFDPIPVVHDLVSDQPNGLFKLLRNDSNHWQLCRQLKDSDGLSKWDSVHRFSLQPHKLADFQETCNLYARGGDPYLMFLSTLPLAIVKENGGRGARMYTRRSYRRYEDIWSRDRRIRDKEDNMDAGRMEEVLRVHFGIVVDLSGVDFEGLLERAAGFTDV